MRPINELTSTATPLPLPNIDTDQIIPKQFLKRIERTGYEDFLFYDWRRIQEGPDTGKPNPDFVLNKPEYKGAEILLAERNFGCGSSREHAPIALGAAGCQVVVAEGFARIFFRNSIATGELYPYESTVPLCDVIKTGDHVEVDFDKDEVRANGKTYPLKPLGEVKPVIDAGGIFNFARQSGLIPARAEEVSSK
jgi:3-isopropylmalate/(R)-2-methylmalate dehydratase small subunit